MGSPTSPKVLIIGLDCCAPEWVFHHPDYDLPNLHRLMQQGSHSTLRSCDPPITVPAWSSMMSGRDPGALGIYGFRNRRCHEAYEEYSIATSLSVKEPRVWDILSDVGKDVCVIGVPQTFPVSPVKGCIVSSILTPGLDSDCVFPESLKAEIVHEIGDICFDIEDFRNQSENYLLEQLNEFLHNRFDLAEHVMRTQPWDFFMMVEMGLDRLHHAFWHYADPEHPKFQEDSPYRWVLRDYYVSMDKRIGQLLEIGGDDTHVLVVSDHGAKSLHGGLRINQWLMEQGYLHLKTTPAGPQPFRLEDVDWSRTKAWGEGGYYGRIFLNIAGREGEGVLAPEEVPTVRAELQAALEVMSGPNGSPMGNTVLLPESIYPEVCGVAPDLMVYFGDLHWRSLGEVGCDSIYAETNDTGADAANHAMDGIVIANRKLSLGNAGLMDVAPTVLSWLGVEVPASTQGRAWADETIA